jgi:hypothetical protein
MAPPPLLLDLYKSLFYSGSQGSDLTATTHHASGAIHTNPHWSNNMFWNTPSSLAMTKDPVDVALWKESTPYYKELHMYLEELDMFDNLSKTFGRSRC